MLADCDSVGLLLVYQSSRCPTLSLPELGDLVSDVRLEFPKLLVLRDFNVHIKSREEKPAQDFLAARTALGLTQVLSGPMHQGGHTLDLISVLDWVI